MSSIQLENTYTEDERWLEAGASAFALHIAACCYSDRLNKDGRIPKAMAYRVALAVQPEAIPAAVAALLDTGFWEEDGADYVLVGYLEDKIGLSAEEKDANRARWAKDKARQRRHSMGNHDLCTPRMCPMAKQMSTKDTASDSTRESTRVSSTTTRLDTTRLDTTRPDSGGARESGRESWSAEAAPAHGSAAPEHPAPEGGEETRRCVECTKRRAIAEMAQDELTSVWRCLACVPEPSPKRRTGILPVPEPGTYKSKREIEREHEQAMKAKEEAERARVAAAFKEAAS